MLPILPVTTIHIRHVILLSDSATMKMQSVIHVVNSLLLPAAAGSAGNVYPSVDAALEMHATPRLSTMRAGMKQLGAAVGPALLDPSVSMTVFAPADSGFERAMAEFYSSDKADLSEADKVRAKLGQGDLKMMHRWASSTPSPHRVGHAHA